MQPDDDMPLSLWNPAAIVFDTEVAIALVADMRIQAAIERGDFEDLPGSGQPLDLTDAHDPDWWLKSLMRRERIVMLPPSIELRKEDATLDDRLDRIPTEATARREIERFNERVVRARYQLPVGPPLVTMPRDTEATLVAWAERRAARRTAEMAARAREEVAARARRRRWPWGVARRSGGPAGR